MQQFMYHDFAVEECTGPVLLGEASQCNNDNRVAQNLEQDPAGKNGIKKRKRTAASSFRVSAPVWPGYVYAMMVEIPSGITVTVPGRPSSDCAISSA